VQDKVPFQRLDFQARREPGFFILDKKTGFGNLARVGSQSLEFRDSDLRACIQGVKECWVDL
jgi:hypothetical protein